MDSASLLHQTRPTTPSRLRLSDEEVVSLAAHLLGDPRAWAAAGLAPGPAAREAASRALRLLEDAIATV
jgi:hypothetical protein